MKESVKKFNTFNWTLKRRGEKKNETNITFKESTGESF